MQYLRTFVKECELITFTRDVFSVTGQLIKTTRLLAATQSMLTPKTSVSREQSRSSLYHTAGPTSAPRLDVSPTASAAAGRGDKNAHLTAATSFVVAAVY